MPKPWTAILILCHPSDRKLINKMGPPEIEGKPIPVVDDENVKRGRLKMIGKDWTEAEFELTQLS